MESTEPPSSAWADWARHYPHSTLRFQEGSALALHRLPARHSIDVDRVFVRVARALFNRRRDHAQALVDDALKDVPQRLRAVTRHIAEDAIRPHVEQLPEVTMCKNALEDQGVFDRCYAHRAAVAHVVVARTPEFRPELDARPSPAFQHLLSVAREESRAILAEYGESPPQVHAAVARVEPGAVWSDGKVFSIHLDGRSYIVYCDDDSADNVDMLAYEVALETYRIALHQKKPQLLLQKQLYARMIPHIDQLKRTLRRVPKRKREPEPETEE